MGKDKKAILERRAEMIKNLTEEKLKVRSGVKAGATSRIGIIPYAIMPIMPILPRIIWDPTPEPS